jgi:putative ABC transport system permease protein
MAVRAAIGARRSRLLGQLMAESVTLSVLGGVVGVMLGWWLTRLLVAAAPSDIPLLDAVVFNWRAVMAAAVATGTSAVLVGLLPALQTSRTNLQPLLHGSRIQSGAGEGRLRLLLVAAQVALATVVLVAAVLLTRSFVKLNAVEHGFDVNRLLVVELDLPGVRYPNAESQAAFYRELLDRLRRAPGVLSAASTSSFPGAGAGMTFSYGIEGRPAPSANGREDARPLQAVSPGYFEAMAIPVVEGRSFQATDDARGLPVVVINRALAALHWPDSSPLGQRLSARPGQTPWLEVVGVVGDTRDEGLDEPAPPTLYLPFDQAVSVWGWLTRQNFVIRTASDPASVTPLVADAVWALDPELPLLNVSTMA